MILRSINGKTIKVIAIKNDKIKNQEYLACSEVIDCFTSVIKDKAVFLTGGKGNKTDNAKKLFYFVRDGIKYRIALFQKIDRKQFKASLTLKRGYGFCISKAILLIALCRACEIPARLHLADIRNHRIPEALKKFIGTDILLFHGYADIFINDRWVKVNPAFDIELCRRNNFIPVEFNGYKDALSHPFDTKGRPHIEYLKDRGSFTDLPLDLILQGLKEYYGPLDERRMAEWNQGYYL